MVTTNEDWVTDDTDALFSVIVELEDITTAADFFRDLCTRKELEDMAARWRIVRLLDEGIPYRQIAEETGASTATISRINQWLQHGTGGYRWGLDQVKEGQ